MSKTIYNNLVKDINDVNLSDGFEIVTLDIVMIFHKNQFSRFL